MLQWGQLAPRGIVLSCDWPQAIAFRPRGPYKRAGATRNGYNLLTSGCPGKRH